MSFGPWSLAAAVLLLCVPFNPPSFSAALGLPLSPSRKIVRVLTYNIHAWRDSDHRDNFDRVAEVILACRPDVVCLNEVLHPFRSPGGREGAAYYEAVRNGKGRTTIPPPDAMPKHEAGSNLARLSSVSGLRNYAFGIAAKERSYFGEGIPFGNAILSRHPLEVKGHMELEVEPGDVELGNQSRDFVDPRSAIFASVGIEFGDEGEEHQMDLGVVSTHLDHKSEELREKQVLKVIRDAPSLFSPSQPHIFCGDLNTFQRSDVDDDGWDRILNLYESRGWGRPSDKSLVLSALETEGYEDAFYRADANRPGTVRVMSDAIGLEPDGTGGRRHFPDPTCWTRDPLMRIDHVWTSPVRPEDAFWLVPQQYSRVLVTGSDHFPIMVDFELVPCKED